MAESIIWTPADGAADVYLTDEDAGYSAEADGTRGFRSVTYGFATSRYAAIDGVTVDAVTVEPNRPTLGLFIQADNEADLRQRFRALTHAMRAKAGPGTLTVATETGERRSLTCYLEGGLEGDESDDTHLPGRWWKVALRFYAPSPWWEGAEQAIALTLGGTAVDFFPLPPVNLTASTVQGQFEVDLSDADAPSYPLWTVTGPGTSLVLENETTGGVIIVNAELTAGETLIIDTRPSRQSVRRGDGANLMGSLASDPALWPLEERLNVVSAQLTDATTDSRITGTFRPRYSGV